MYTKKQKTLGLLICASVILVTLFSVLFISGTAKHHCTGTSCPVCESIGQARKALRQLGAGITETACSFPVICFWTAGCLGLLFILPCTSLVTQKVRMDN